MQKLLSIILCLQFMSLINNDCFAQDNTDTKSAQHTVYVEGLGNAGFYSIGYDYTLKLHERHKLSFKCGLGYIPEYNKSDKRFMFEAFQLPIAPEISYLYGKKHHLELGVGVTCMPGFDSPVQFIHNDGWRWSVPFRIGYRYQKENGGFFFKAAGIPIIWLIYGQDTEDSDIPEKLFVPWGGVAVGYTFKHKK